MALLRQGITSKVAVVLASFIGLLAATPVIHAADEFVYIGIDGVEMDDLDGGNHRVIVPEGTGYHLYPALSSDGKLISFQCSDIFDGICLVDSDGQNLRLLIPDSNSEIWGAAAFSPDRSELLFTRWSPQTHDIYSIDLDSQNERRITTDQYALDPTFNPDGNYIVFADSTYTGYGNIARINRDGTNKRAITPVHGPNPEYYDQQPSVSPDGKQIVFTRSPDAFMGDIWKVNSNGTGLTRLTNFHEQGELLASDPSWSNDGSTILFHVLGGEEPSWALWTMDTDGSNQRLFDWGAMGKFHQPNAIKLGGDLFDDIDVELELDPEGDYLATVTATDSVYGIARYELLAKVEDSDEYVLKDSVDLNCTPSCPKKGPEKTLVLSSYELENGESDIRVEAVDGSGERVSASRTVSKKFYHGITEPRVGRVLKSANDPLDPNPNPIYDPVVFSPDLADQRFTDLKPRYFRLFVPWERLEPEKDRYEWNADVGGGYTPGNLYKATIDDQINRMRELSPGVKIVAVFADTPCWAVIPQARKWDGTQYMDPCRSEYGRFPDNNPYSWPDPNQGMVDQYKQFVGEFIKRYSGPDVLADKRIYLYSAWNEPNYFALSQPQKCGQAHKKPSEYPEFAQITCPDNSPQGAMTGDNYYYKFYSALYDTLKADVQGMPGTKFDPAIKVVGGETAGVVRGARSYDSDEATFTESVVKQLKKDRRCGADSKKVKRLGAWAKHAYSDLQGGTYTTVSRVRRTLDGLDHVTGEPKFDTEGCTKNKQIWVTEMAAIYPPVDPSKPTDQPCDLHDFLEGVNTAPEEPLGSGKHPDLRRTDVYMQYLYQTDWDNVTKKGFNSGLLYWDDVNPPDGLLDTRDTLNVFTDWADYSHGGPRPTRQQYEGLPLNCENFWN